MKYICRYRVDFSQLAKIDDAAAYDTAKMAYEASKKLAEKQNKEDKEKQASEYLRIQQAEVEQQYKRSIWTIKENLLGQLIQAKVFPVDPETR